MYFIFDFSFVSFILLDIYILLISIFFNIDLFLITDLETDVKVGKARFERIWFCSKDHLQS